MQTPAPVDNSPLGGRDRREEVATSEAFAGRLRDHLAGRLGESIDVIETRVSWVFLAHRLAFKMKKPVRLGFLDFTDLEARRRACSEELRLNRRFSPSLYRQVIAVRGTRQAPHIGGEGAPIDYLVCMRRLPVGALLSEHLARNSLNVDDVARVARRVADFHRETIIARRSIAFGWPEQTLQAAMDVVKRVGQSDPRTARLRTWIEAQAWALWDVWLARRRAGFVRDCHGDLHLANIALVGDHVVPFDCLEFDASLRWTDVMSDVAFLAMDLDAHGRSDLAFRFIDAYLEATGDFDGLRVMRFQVVYRALVRAMATAGTSGDGIDYVACAERWSGRPSPRLLITHGLSGSGKSSVALQLAQRTGAIRLRSDVERKRLFGLDPSTRRASDCPDIHSQDANRRVRDRLLAGARVVLQAGFPAIVDATFLRAEDRAAFRGLADSESVAFDILDCQADDATLRTRIESRQRQHSDASDATIAVLARQRAAVEPLTSDERAQAMTIVAGVPLDVDALARRWMRTAKPDVTLVS